MCHRYQLSSFAIVITVGRRIRRQCIHCVSLIAMTKHHQLQRITFKKGYITPFNAYSSSYFLQNVLNTDVEESEDAAVPHTRRTAAALCMYVPAADAQAD